MPKREPFIRSLPWNPYAAINPKYVIETRTDHPTLKTLTLAASDGPECYYDFDPAVSVDDRNDEEGSLLNAIAHVAEGMIECAVEEEARQWAEHHDTIWVVMGFTGERDALGDKPGVISWNAKAFLDRDRAVELMDELNEWCKSKGLNPGGSATNRIVDPSGSVVHCPLDKGFRVNGGTEYHLASVPLDLTPEPFWQHD